MTEIKRNLQIYLLFLVINTWIIIILRILGGPSTLCDRESKKQGENDRYLIARGSLSIKQQFFISITETVTFTRYQTFC